MCCGGFMNQKDFIKEYDFKFKKKFGQNFLTDDNILNNIVDSASVDDDTLVIEIGCGAGALTKKLVKCAKKVIGYEIDETLSPILSTIDGVDIIYCDFLKRDVKKDLEKYSYKKLYVIANLPYYITTPIITKIIEDKIDVDKIVVMVQKEVGDRFSAKPNTKDYNSLTLFINYYFNVKKLFVVSKNVFIPKPNVDSIVVSLEKRSGRYNVINEDIFFKLVKDSFKQKRKTLKNNLKDYNFALVKEVLSKYNFNEDVRAEALPIEVFVEISNRLS